MTDKAYINHLVDQCNFVEKATERVRQTAMWVADLMTKAPKVEDLEHEAKEAQDTVKKIHDAYLKHQELARQFKECVTDMQNVSTATDVDWRRVTNNTATFDTLRHEYLIEHSGATQFLSAILGTIECLRPHLR